MNKSIKIMGIVFLSLGLIVLVAYWWLDKAVGEIDVPSTTNNYIVNFNNTNSNLYFSARAWGLAGNNEEIHLSSSPFTETKQTVKDENYVFYTSELYYKKKGKDTLIVYVGTSAISKPPRNFNTPITIQQIELKNYDEVKDYEKNYKKYGLSKVSIYKEK